ncbi:TPA: hypothetical protein O4G62_003513 [Vibrio alginolyticus]|uniref:hypothetical protein n=1 Tax=Vibrio alginolyticus TaxID=663 RepID=UPI001BD26DB9|nr:hypothetical protein [Vibrio alginolyticus]MBS9854701.1 hypothetical protein [Vibrio alginolyticus]HCZ9271941.1 hypothetical protein [Vibrio alginolyticus]
MREAFNQALLADASHQPVPDAILTEVLEAFRKERVDAARFHQQLMSIDPFDFFAAEDDWF